MVIYWSVPRYSDEIFLGLDHPKSAFVDFKSVCPPTSQSDPWTDFTMCPSVTDFSRNLFAIKSPISLEFWWDGTDIHFENNFSEDFFRKIVVIRDAKGGSLSLRIVPYFFFCEQDCEMQYSMPLMTNNNFTTNCLVVPGQVNIGKWFRPTDHAFLIKEKNQRIKINKGDTIANIRFSSKDKITFKKFYFTDRCDEFFNKVVAYKKSQSNKIKDYLSVMYKDFEASRLKNTILKEIKNNIME